MTAEGPFDWAGARRRLAEIEGRLERSLSPSPEAMERILEERRARLARRGAAEAAGSEGQLELVVFTLGKERYALETRYLIAVLPLEHLTPIPGAPAFLAGVTNLRGEVLAVFDLGRFSEVEREGLDERARVVVVGGGRPELGLLADGAEEVRRVRTRALEALAAPLTRLAGLLRGVTEDGLIVLDGARLLAEKSFYVDQSGERGPREV